MHTSREGLVRGGLMSRAGTRWLLGAFFVAYLLFFELAAFRGQAFALIPGGRVAGALLGALVFGGALVLLRAGPPALTTRAGRFLVAAAIVLAVRFQTSRALDAWSARAPAPTSRSAPLSVSAGLTTFLREAAAAQEQYRLRHGSYAPSADSLAAWTEAPPQGTLSITRNAAKGWAARFSSGGATCTLWVRDSTLRTEATSIEGTPTCSPASTRAPHQVVHTVLAADQPEAGFRAGDISGDWTQHRADARRSGAAGPCVSDATAYRWTTSIGGEIRSPVAVAGNQVFVGAHGNGEFVALRLDSGTLGFRVRAPNWIHNEPAVTRDLVIADFGNNEDVQIPSGPAPIGTAPSGIVAYDRRTGVERWHRYTTGPVMTSPVVRDSVVFANVSSRMIIAWRVQDGTELWRVPLPSKSWMGNPLLSDSLLIIGLDPTWLCAINVRSRAPLYCRELAKAGGGAGLSSPAASGDAVLQVFEQDASLLEMARGGWWKAVLDHVLGIPHVQMLQQVLVDVEMTTGRERWRAPLGVGDRQPDGHHAGTPSVDSGVAYVPSPINGHVIAVKMDSGRVLWSTDVNTSRGAVLVVNRSVLVATRDTSLVVLDAVTGHVRCRQRLPGESDRAGPTLVGGTAILTLHNGMILARPLADWLGCRA